jgi:hypothetical protein
VYFLCQGRHGAAGEHPCLCRVSDPTNGAYLCDHCQAQWLDVIVLLDGHNVPRRVGGNIICGPCQAQMGAEVPPASRGGITLGGPGPVGSLRMTTWIVLACTWFAAVTGLGLVLASKARRHPVLGNRKRIAEEAEEWLRGDGRAPRG